MDFIIVINVILILQKTERKYKIMKRYHKEVYIPISDLKKLKSFNNKLNELDWTYSRHCLSNLKHRVIDIKGVLDFIKNTVLDYNNIFEYYTLYGNIEKACYRLPWNNNIDICLVISKLKNIITIYINNKEDKHITLKHELYQKEVI